MRYAMASAKRRFAVQTHGRALDKENGMAPPRVKLVSIDGNTFNRRYPPFRHPINRISTPSMLPHVFSRLFRFFMRADGSKLSTPENLVDN